MSLAVKELLRQPGRFVPVGVALTLLVILLVVLGGFLDGLELNQTGAYRAHEGRLLVFDAEADTQIQRSRISQAQATAIATMEGVAAVGQLNLAATTVSPDSSGAAQIEDVILFGYDEPTDVIPAPPGERAAVVDAALADLIPVDDGDTLLVGPGGQQVTVDGITDDLTQGAPTLWLSTSAWREIVAAGDPTVLPPRGTFQALVVTPAGKDVGDQERLARRIQTAVSGVVVATPEEVIDSLEVVQAQSSTFAGIIAVTFAVTLLVVALFFALITLERVGLYAVLKAVGARSADLVVGISVQAVLVSVMALAVGMAASLAFVAVLPPDLPIRLTAPRLGLIVLGTVVTALVGSLFTLRRILSIDPAEAIG